MQTVREIPTARKAPKAFYATLDNDEVHGVLSQIDGTILFFADDGAILDYTPEMAPWLTLNGEVSLTETARILDTLHGGAAWIASHRLQEVA